MIVPIVGCILAGCLQDVPVVVGKDPLRYYLEPKQRVDKTPMACYIEGVFYTTCPK